VEILQYTRLFHHIHVRQHNTPKLQHNAQSLQLQQRNIFHFPSTAEILSYNHHDNGPRNVHNPPIHAPWQSVVVRAQDQVHQKERCRKIQTLFALFDNNRQNDGTRQRGQENGTAIGPAGHVPEVNVLVGKDTIQSDRLAVQKGVDLQKDGQYKVVKALQTDNLRGNQLGVKVGGGGLLLGPRRGFA